MYVKFFFHSICGVVIFLVGKRQISVPWGNHDAHAKGRPMRRGGGFARLQRAKRRDAANLPRRIKKGEAIASPFHFLSEFFGTRLTLFLARP